jgi:hypothetical protein
MQATVGRIGDERGSVVPVAFHSPDRAVIARVTIHALEAAFGAVHIRKHAEEDTVAERSIGFAGEEFVRLLLHGRNLRVSQGGAARQFFRAFEGRGVVWTRSPAGPDVHPARGAGSISSMEPVRTRPKPER